MLMMMRWVIIMSRAVWTLYGIIILKVFFEDSAGGGGQKVREEEHRDLKR